MKSFITPKETREIIGISYRQLQYWDNSRFISPSYRSNKRNGMRQYTFSDLILLKTAKQLRDKGYSIQRLRKVMGNAKQLLNLVTSPKSNYNILVDGDDVILFTGDVQVSDSSLERMVIIKTNDVWNDAVLYFNGKNVPSSHNGDRVNAPEEVRNYFKKNKGMYGVHMNSRSSNGSNNNNNNGCKYLSDISDMF